MKVKQLIEQLQALDPEAIVFIRGYEAGYDDVNSIKPNDMVLNVNSVWYYGKHDLLENLEKKDKILNRELNHNPIKGIIISYEENFS
jgi:hypothetical protein